MIKRLYVDNFRTLVDFTWSPDPETLILGCNGSGKTTVLDSIDLIRSWAWGWERLDQLLSRNELCRWSTSEVARFEVDIDSPDGLFRYEVEFESGRRGGDATVRSEALRLGEGSVFVRNGAAVTVHNGLQDPVAHYSLPTNQSAVVSIFASENAELAGRFLTQLSRMIVVRPMPPLLQTEAKTTEARARYYFENFIGWYLHWSQQGNFSREWVGLLNEVWEDFDFVQSEKIGRDQIGLSVVFKVPRGNSGQFKLEFHELSEGERMIFILYALLAYQKSEGPTTIAIDEPDNFVSLAELQPWLLRMLDERQDLGQIIIVSHNSEIIQTFGFESASWFGREDHLTPTTVSQVDVDATGLNLADRFRRGWIDNPSTGSKVN